ncbi:MAG: autotransporter outer membrane beta-barrel domain-containing protein [Planctomycetia bacterium]|nr:autotransporter outer membrane beta-barrel domain-containing protein [Planctomycetia bacterium]
MKSLFLLAVSGMDAAAQDMPLPGEVYPNIRKILGAVSSQTMDNYYRRSGDLPVEDEDPLGAWYRFKTGNIAFETKTGFDDGDYRMYQVGGDWSRRFQDSRLLYGFLADLVEIDTFRVSKNAEGETFGDISGGGVGGYITYLKDDGFMLEGMWRFTAGKVEIESEELGARAASSEENIIFSLETGKRVNLAKSLTLLHFGRMMWANYTPSHFTDSKGVYASFNTTNLFTSQIGLKLTYKPKETAYFFAASYFQGWGGTFHSEYWTSDGEYSRADTYYDPTWWSVSTGFNRHYEKGNIFVQYDAIFGEIRGWALIVGLRREW